MKTDHRFDVAAQLVVRVARMLPAWAAIGLLLLALPGNASADLLPTVQFAFPQYSVAETGGFVPVAIVINQPPFATLFVSVSFNDGTAIGGSDFVGGGGNAVFQPAGPDTAYAYVEIRGDSQPEVPETILMQLTAAPGFYDVGPLDAVTLTIIDNDSGTPRAHFEIQDAVPLDFRGQLVVPSLPGAILSVDVVVESMPPGGTTIYYQSSADAVIRSLSFVGNARQTIEVPASEISAGFDYAVNELEILNSSAKSSSSGDRLALVSLSALGIGGPTDCLACLFAYYSLVLGNLDCQTAGDLCGFICPLQLKAEETAPPGPVRKALDLAADLTTLRRYRDEVLLGSVAGDFFIQLYQDLSPDLAIAILQRPGLYFRVSETWEMWMPAIAAQVNGQGAGFQITAGMQAALLGILTEFAEVGSPELAVQITDFRQSLDLDHVEGITASGLQARLESSSLGVENMSWGDLKSQFR